MNLAPKGDPDDRPSDGRWNGPNWNVRPWHWGLHRHALRLRTKPVLYIRCSTN